MVKVYVLGVVGVPVRAPVVVFSVRPGGNVPVEENVNVLVLPVTVMVWLYAKPTFPGGSVPGLSDIVGHATTIV